MLYYHCRKVVKINVHSLIFPPKGKHLFLYESTPKPGHTPGASGRSATALPSGNGQAWVQQAMLTQATCLLREFLKIEETSPERLLRNTNQENLKRTYGKTKPTFEQQLNCKTEKHIIYGCGPVNRLF